MPLSRRQFLAGIAVLGGTQRLSVTAAEPGHRQRVIGMLLGSLIGDALGGPIEFLTPDKVTAVMPGARNWDAERTVDADQRRDLAAALRMHPYTDLRPDTAAYGPWVPKAPRGTITDDSRHKIVLMRGLKRMLREGRERLTEADLANEFIRFRPHPDRIPDARTAALVDQGMQQYRYASRWILGDRDFDKALPVERLWSGISNCSGQMLLMPLAAIFAGDPDRAYRQTYAIDFVDAPIARDIVSALNAGLAAALDPKLNAEVPAERWTALLAAMRSTDPFRFNDVPFAGRPLNKWLDLADSIVKRAQGRPSRAYKLLETEGKPVYYWDAHFTLLVPLTMLKLCKFDPLAAMHLTLDFGHDTDSYAQVLGALAGAVHGLDIFPQPMSNAVNERLRQDYGESIDDWANTLHDAATVWPT